MHCETGISLLQSNKKKVSLADIEAWEYGYSKAVWELCPDDWKKPLGNDWEDVLKIIISKWSPQTYLCREQEMKKEQDFHCQFPAQMASLRRRIYKEHKVELKDLEVLNTVYLVVLEKETVLSKISPEQRILIDSLGLEMEV